MLTVHGRPHRFCDGVSRRSFLKIGAFAFGAAHFTLADVLRAEQTLGKTSHKAVINVFLGGGPPLPGGRAQATKPPKHAPTGCRRWPTARAHRSCHSRHLGHQRVGTRIQRPWRVRCWISAGPPRAMPWSPR